jgi:Fis family transcriptional regulator, factor for inversion stimulation protein
MENDVLTMTPEAQSIVKKPQTQSLRTSVRESLQHYFAQLDGQTPANLYGMVLAEVEKPLLEMVLQLTNNNQSKAAKVLGISRGTLRKKMAIYDLF